MILESVCSVEKEASEFFVIVKDARDDDDTWW